MVRVKGTVYGIDGKVYAVIDGRRILIAKCNPEIRVYEKTVEIKAIGMIKRQEKTSYCSIVFCADTDETCPITNSMVERMTDVEITFDVTNTKGETVYYCFNRLETNDIDSWEFRCDLEKELAEQLLS